MEQAGEYRVLALPAPNHAVELTAYSVRCAPAFGSSSPLAFGIGIGQDINPRAGW
jgi:hypothetical protein